MIDYIDDSLQRVSDMGYVALNTTALNTPALNAKELDTVQPSKLPSYAGDKELIAKLYDQLFQEGYFSDRPGGLGGNEGYLSRFELKHIPQGIHSYLEIGPGSGLFAKQVIAQRPHLSHLSAIELAPEMAAACYEQLSPVMGARGGTVSVYQGDFDLWYEKLLSKGQKFDVVFSSYVAEHMIDPEAFLGKMRALTASGGVTMLADVIRPNRFEAMASWKSILVDIAMWSSAYLNSGMLPPIGDMMRSVHMLKILDEPAFKMLMEIDPSYEFPLDLWKTLAAQVSGAKFAQLTRMTGVLVIPKA